ncbi:MAG TPA: hypothetical protein VFV63_08115 [Ilumatobacteraceae bacterium]|nr:hypothetical protein [Ilumatobacteraceae bacterium]
MAAPKFVPTLPTDSPRGYGSPDHVPDTWMPDRPGELDGAQPRGPQLGTQGPDQGYALKLANRLRPSLRLQPGERADDAVRGCLGIALRRASLFGRAPIIHDLRMAFTIWGFLDEDPPPDLVECRRKLFAGVGNVMHHYAEGRRVADMVPESTLRAGVDEVGAIWRDRWVELTGATPNQRSSQ